MTIETEYAPDAPRSLGDVRVLDLSRLVAGNAVTHVMADHGAEVIKIERPEGGDDLRNWKTRGVSLHWKVYCRNKKSVTLDLRQPRGREILLDLAAGAQVLVENFKPGTIERWGIGPAELHARNPGLVIVRVSGWGQDGIWAHKPGFGSLVEAMSGFAAMNGFGDRPPVLPPLALADMIAGLWGAFATMVAIRAVEQGGQGQVIDLPLFEPIHAVLGPMAAQYRMTGENPERTGSRSTQTAPRGVYETADGRFVALSGSMQAMAERFFRAIGRPELIEDPRFATNSDRVAHNDALDPIVAEYMGRYTQAELLALFEAADVTVGPVADIDQLMDHPYVNDRAILVDLPDDEIGRVPMPNVVPRMGGTPAAIRTPAPALGAHTGEVLEALGLTVAEIAALKGEGVV
ncbi:MAG: CoA transferase [Pseudomonadota bacterium]